MKILHVSETSIYNYDGISTYINELLLCSKQNGDETLFLTTTPLNSDVRKPLVEDVKVIAFPCFRFPGKPKFITVFPLGIKKIINDFHPDLIWIHTIGTLGMKAASLAKGKYPVVYTKHCFDGLMWNTYFKIPKPFHGFLNFWADYFEAKILRNVNKVIYHIADRSRVAKNPYLYKFLFFPPPLPERFFKNIPVRVRESNKLVFGFCGRCEPDKGLDDTLLSLKIFHYQHPDIELEYIIIGDGPEAERILNEYKFLKITVTGYVNDVIPYLDKLDAYILTSKHEMIALSSLEASARGLPVFSVPIGYLRENSTKIKGFHLFQTQKELAKLLYEVLIENTDNKNPSEINGLSAILQSYPELYSKIIKLSKEI